MTKVVKPVCYKRASQYFCPYSVHMCILFRRAWRPICAILNNPPDAGHTGNRFRLLCLPHPKTMNNHHHNTHHTDEILRGSERWRSGNQPHCGPKKFPDRPAAFTLFPVTTRYPSQHHIGMRWQHQRNQMWKGSCDLCWNSCWPGVTQRRHSTPLKTWCWCPLS